jgi:hypothetical protein
VRPLFSAQDSKGRRLVRYRDGARVLIDNLSGPKKGHREHYDRAADPEERQEIGHEGALEAQLGAFKKTLAAPGAATGFESNTESLRALGYVQ